jgi:hypothetical protein
MARGKSNPGIEPRSYQSCDSGMVPIVGRMERGPSDANPYADAHSFAYGIADSDANANPDSDRDTYTDTYTDSHPYTRTWDTWIRPGLVRGSVWIARTGLSHIRERPDRGTLQRRHHRLEGHNRQR